MRISVESNRPHTQASQNAQRVATDLKAGTGDAFSEFRNILKQVANIVQSAGGSGADTLLDIASAQVTTKSEKEKLPVKEKETSSESHESKRLDRKEARESGKQEICSCEEEDERKAKEKESDTEEVSTKEQGATDKTQETAEETQAEEVSQEEQQAGDEQVDLEHEEILEEIPVEQIEANGEESVDDAELEAVAQASAEVQKPIGEEEVPLEELPEEVLEEPVQQEEIQVKEDSADTGTEQQTQEEGIDISDMQLEDSEVVASSTAGTVEVETEEGSSEKSGERTGIRTAIEKLLRQAATQNEATPDEGQTMPQFQSQGQQLSSQIRQLVQTVKQGSSQAATAGQNQQAATQAKGGEFNPMQMGVQMKGQDTSNETAQSKESKPLPRSLQQKAISKIEEVLKEVSSSKKGKTLSVRLDPPRLGSVRIEASIQDGNLSARIVAENPQVQQLLKERGLELQQMLRRLGLNMDQITVTVGGDHESAGKEYFQEHLQQRGAVGVHEAAGFEGDASEGVQTHDGNTTDYWVA